MKSLDNEWFDFTIKYVDKLNDNDGNWDALSEEEQELAALWRL